MFSARKELDRVRFWSRCAARPTLLALPRTSFWPYVRAAAGVGTSVALHAARSKNGAAPQLPLDEVSDALKSMQSAPVLERYLSTALDPWPTDYLAMQPLTKSSEKTASASTMLNDLLVQGTLREVDYMDKQLDRHWLVLATCDVQGAGFVCGVGLAESCDEAKRLAAQQAMDRIALPSDFVKEISRCAQAVRTHKHHAGARVPAQHAAESLEGLTGFLEDVRVCAFCPCGKAWMAAISARALHGNLVLASSADYSQEVAMALAAEVFISRLRWNIRVPPDEPHAPREWARTWQQRAAAKDPWGGVTRRIAGQKIEIREFGGKKNEELLRDLIGTDESQYSRHATLREASLSRFARTAQQGTSAKENPTKDGASVVEAVHAVTPRPYEITPAAQDPRRKEIIGSLPVEAVRAELAEALEHAQVVLVSGGTGSGKSTQIPQFLLDDSHCQSSSATPHVVVTQPRRIAAISVAERVAWERKQQVGDMVGYAVQGSVARATSSQGTIEYVTVGTLLRRAVSDPLLKQCDVIVVDEVHERDLLTDFLLILVREILPQRPALRLVLMSATVDIATFTNYFNQCPVLKVPAGTLYPVEEVFLCDEFFREYPQAQFLLQEEENMAAAAMMSDRDDLLGRAWDGGEEVSTALLELMQATIIDLATSRVEPSSAILCFLPGWPEIRHLCEQLQECSAASQLWVLPLHSTLPKEQQKQVFQKAPAGKVKVILGTNIAESSITIQDISIVLDSGLQRELTYNPRRRMSSLDTVWISTSNAIQRKGRAGRVQAGRVLRLYSQTQMKRLLSSPAPEMQRGDLAQVCLQAVALGRDARRFLAEAPDPPSVDSVETAMDVLVRIDAIEEGLAPRILPSGEVLARLPVEPLLGRAAMLGALLGVPEAAAAILVVSGGRSPFVSSTHSKDEVRSKMSSFCGWSDVFSAARALFAWEKKYRDKGEVAGRSWARANLLNPSQLATFSRLKQQLLRDMHRSKIVLEGLQQLSAYDDQDVEPPEDDGDASSGILESWEEVEGSLDTGENSGNATIDDNLMDDRVEMFLKAVLCTAYAANLARRPNSSSSSFATKGVRAARISPSSVNAVYQKTSSESGGTDPEWFLYSEMQSSGDKKKKAYLQNTTRLDEWQVGAFAGLMVKDLQSEEDPVIELDGWIGLRGYDADATRLVRGLRRELQDAFSWQALYALSRGKDVLAGSYANRAAALLKVAFAILAQEKVDDSTIEFLRNWKAPEPSKSGTNRVKAKAKKARSDSHVSTESPTVEHSLDDKGAAGPTSAQPSVPADVDGKTVAELKRILREMGLKVSGNKAQLVERYATAVAKENAHSST